MGKNKPQTSTTADSANSEASGLATLVSVTFTELAEPQRQVFKLAILDLLSSFHRKKLTIDQLIQKPDEREFALIRDEMKANLGKITKENDTLKDQLNKLNAEMVKLRKVDKPTAKGSKSKRNEEESLKSNELNSLSTALAKVTERSNVLHELTTALKLLNDALKMSPSSNANSSIVNTALEALEHLNNKIYGNGLKNKAPVISNTFEGLDKQVDQLQVNQRHQTIVLSTLLVQKAAELRQQLNANRIDSGIEALLKEFYVSKRST
ncbi:hypothetical protein M3Y94_01249100 [Aphelenchoides besseyi]|nr:hypothetical protein M3Y94_01249100 [Aphelenchoides besseyi]KAI6219391.1 hypothetical protein M3Y95_01106200 [Aphelenchoides besseyi]